MEFEKLALQVSAKKAGLTMVTPPQLQGRSGILHKFDMVFTDGRRYYAFDIYDRVTETETIRTYSKKIDTNSWVGIVCQNLNATNAARSLAQSYNVKIMSPEASDSFFVQELVRPQSPSV